MSNERIGEAERRRDEFRARMSRSAARVADHWQGIEHEHRQQIAMMEASSMGMHVAQGLDNSLPKLAPRLPAREQPARIMWAKKHLTDEQMLAADRVAMLVRMSAATQRIVAWAGDTTGGGGAGADAVSDGLARSLDAQAQWGMLTARILMDSRCGAVLEHRRVVVHIVEQVCAHDVSIAELTRVTKQFGGRALAGKRLRSGLQVIAEALGDLRAHRREADAAFHAATTAEERDAA